MKKFNLSSLFARHDSNVKSTRESLQRVPPSTWSMPGSHAYESSESRAQSTPLHVPLRSLMAVFLFLTLLGFVSMLWRWSSPQYSVCTTQLGPCWPELDSQIAKYVHQPIPLAWYQLKYILPNIHQGIHSVELHYTLSRQLFVRLYVDEPVAQVTSPGLRIRDQYYGVGFNGVIMHKTRQEGLPAIVLNTLQSLPGDHLTSDQVAAVQIVYYLTSLGYQVSAEQTAEDILQTTIEGTQSVQAIFPLNHEMAPEQLVSTLQLILRQTKMNDKYAQIDLRYSKPIIRNSTADPSITN